MFTGDKEEILEPRHRFTESNTALLSVKLSSPSSKPEPRSQKVGKPPRGCESQRK